MNISNNAAVNSAVTATQQSNADSVNLRVLNKALTVQAQSAMALIASATNQPALETSGSVGTRINTYA